MIRDAAISECGRYRYALERRWQSELSPPTTPDVRETLEALCLFVMLNPSTADHHLDDPTVRRCAGFARSWGYTALAVCNLFALRATDPADLRLADDPVGPDNDSWITSYAERGPVVVAAWGTYGGYLRRDREVLEILRQSGHGAGERFGQVFCLGTTRSGQPRHPLYVPGVAIPEPYAG